MQKILLLPRIRDHSTLNIVDQLEAPFIPITTENARDLAWKLRKASDRLLGSDFSIASLVLDASRQSSAQ